VSEAFIAVLDIHLPVQHTLISGFYFNLKLHISKLYSTIMSAYHMNTAPVVYDVQNSTLFGHGVFGDCYSNIMGTAATMFLSTQYQPIFMSVIGSIVVGLSGLFPLLIFPVSNDSISLKTGRKYSYSMIQTYFLLIHSEMTVMKSLLIRFQIILNSFYFNQCFHSKLDSDV